MAYLPGQVLKPEPRATCDEHSERLSVKRIVGETDSFGSEFIEMCSECYEKHKEHKDDYLTEEVLCDICNVIKTGCRPTRDPGEGSSGRVYYACLSCTVTLHEPEQYGED